MIKQYLDHCISLNPNFLTTDMKIEILQDYVFQIPKRKLFTFSTPTGRPAKSDTIMYREDNTCLMYTFPTPYIYQPTILGVPTVSIESRLLEDDGQYSFDERKIRIHQNMISILSLDKIIISIKSDKILPFVEINNPSKCISLSSFKDLFRLYKSLNILFDRISTTSSPTSTRIVSQQLTMFYNYFVRERTEQQFVNRYIKIFNDYWLNFNPK